MATKATLKRLNNRDVFGQAAYLREKDVELPEIGTVRIRELTAAQRLAYLEYLEVGEDGKPHFSQEKQVRFDEFIISMGVLGESGLMFQSPQDVPDMRFDVKEKLTEEILIISELRKIFEVPAKVPNATEKMKPPFPMP